MHPNQITAWTAQLVDGTAEVFGSKSKVGLTGPAIDVTTLHAKIGELTSNGRYLSLYNGRRPHSSLDRRTPDQAYFDRVAQIAAAWNPAEVH